MPADAFILSAWWRHAERKRPTAQGRQPFSASQKLRFSSLQQLCSCWLAHFKTKHASFVMLGCSPIALVCFVLDASLSVVTVLFDPTSLSPSAPLLALIWGG